MLTHDLLHIATYQRSDCLKKGLQLFSEHAVQHMSQNQVRNCGEFIQASENSFSICCNVRMLISLHNVAEAD
jgi:hypothetical protein